MTDAIANVPFAEYELFIASITDDATDEQIIAALVEQLDWTETGAKAILILAHIRECRPSECVGVGIGNAHRRRIERVIAELRKLHEDGMRILPHSNRNDLKLDQYMLETQECRPVIARGISDKLRRQILERNGYTCQICGAGPGEDSGCEPGKKCRLQIDHTIPISQGGTDNEHNLRAVCVYYNKDKANLKVPTSRDAINAMAMIRDQPRDVQIEIYGFLARKFGKLSEEK